MEKPQINALRQTYGFDDVSIVPGNVTINPDQTNVSLKIGDIVFNIPVIAAAMDAVTDVNFTTLMSKAGGLAVLNIEGVYAKYENPEAALEEIIRAPDGEVTGLLQRVYSEPIKDELIARRIKEVKESGAICAVSVTPANTKRLTPVITESGADILVVQSTVTTARHISKSYHGLVFSELCRMVNIPVVVGNCVSYSTCLELMRTGVSGILVGVGPGAACTSRQVLGIGVPQITSTMDCAAAREAYLTETGRYVPIITDGGFRCGGDLCKAIAAGADGVMIGSIFAQTKEAPGKGYHWGMSTPHPALPRGTRIKVGIRGTLEQVLFGPSAVTDGSQNLVGALRVAMGMCGAFNIREMQQAELVLAPSITTEGKYWQLARP